MFGNLFVLVVLIIVLVLVLRRNTRPDKTLAGLEARLAILEQRVGQLSAAAPGGAAANPAGASTWRETSVWAMSCRTSASLIWRWASSWR